MISKLLISLLLGTWSTVTLATFVADSRIRNPNITPMIGRGYSPSTGDVLSTCLSYEMLSEPTYNYDYSYMEIDSKGRTESTSEGSFSGSLSYGWISAQVSGSMKSQSDTNTSKHYIVVKMSMERYYSSMLDNTAVLTDDALSLLKKHDTVGFFQACGSGYIRSLRRTAEVSAIFTLDSKSTSENSEFAAALKIKLFGKSVGGGKLHMNSKSTSSNMDLKIMIRAFGLGLNMEGSDTLVASSLEDYESAIKFAFKSMQNEQVGMIHGAEIVPWLDNLQFQNQLDFSEQLLALDEDGMPNENVSVSAIEIKAMTMINAEFITTLESYYREQLELSSLMTNCVGDINFLLNSSKADNALVDHTRMDFEIKVMHGFVTPKLLSQVVNEDNLAKKFNSVRVFISKFYGPCATAITGASSNGRHTKFWWDFPQCNTRFMNPNLLYLYDNSTDTSSFETFTPQMDDVAIGFDDVIRKYCLPETISSYQEAADSHKLDEPDMTKP